MDGVERPIGRRTDVLDVCCFFCFLEILLVLGKIHKNLEKTKKNKIADPNSPACTDMGLAFLFFFVFFVFFLFFLVLLEKSTKNKKTKKNKIARPMSVQAGELGSAILFFWVFLVLPREIQKNQKKQKKQNCKTYVGTSWWVRVCNFVFFGFFGFTSRNQKKPRKPKLQDLCRYKLVS